MTFLHVVGHTLNELFNRVPLTVARWLLIGVYLLLLFWVVQLPSSQTTPQDRPSKWHQDLRVWAWLAIMIQIVIYGMF